MFIDKDDALGFIAENDIKFIRLAFCDSDGTQKNISIMPTELERALTDGIAVDMRELKTLGCKGELLLRPDLNSFSVLPWRPSHGRVGRFFCRLFTADGKPYPCDCRALLSDAVTEAKKLGLRFSIASECAFYLFNTDGLGDPTVIPYDRAGCLDIAPLDKGENVRREICLTLEEMAMVPESSRHAAGPGQNVVVYRSADPETAADNFLTYKWAVRTIAAKNGLHASFDPLPLENSPANDCVITITLDGADADTFERAAAGISKRLYEMTGFMCPRRDSYKRLGGLAGAEDYPFITNAPNGIKISLPDPSFNPYIVYTLLIKAANIDGDGEIARLPESYEEAMSVASQSAFIREALPETLAAPKTV